MNDQPLPRPPNAVGINDLLQIWGLLIQDQNPSPKIARAKDKLETIIEHFTDGLVVNQPKA
jgi:hypothetical protein